MHKKIDLGQGWTFRKVGEDVWHPANVPGCNITDLFHNGLIGDPFDGTSEAQLQWIERDDWQYRCQFDVDADTLTSDGAIELVFEGLDTICDVSLNGAPLLSADNMFRSWRIDVRDRLRLGDNELLIHFHSPLRKGEELAARDDFTYPAENDKTDLKVSPYMRKAPYHFGWDWGPKYAVSGIWRPVYLELSPTVRIVEVSHHIASLDKDSAVVEFRLELNEAVDCATDLTWAFEDGAGTQILAAGERVLTFSVVIDQPRLWWPNGMGEQALYTFRFGLNGVENEDYRIGLRQIEVINEPDDIGESFYLKVNGVPTFMKGANYIPADSFLDQMTPERYRQLLQDSKDAHFNMIRIWGGGTYEADIFYNLADEMGILIWQDFMFACSLYPADEAFLASVRAEAIEVIKRRRHHACLALWCGNNEVDMGIAYWEWPEKFGYSQARFAQLLAGNKTLFETLLPDLVQQYDAGRFYFPSSPIGHWNDPEDDKKGDGHYWGVWHGELPFDTYNDRLSRFMSEYGFQSYPLLSSIERFAPEGDYHVGSPTLLGRQKHPRGDAIIRRFVSELYGEPRSFEDFCILSQLTQAEAMRVAFEAHRRNRPFCMGTLYWQLNDCWPAISWSGIDYYGQWKALHYQAARSFKPVILSAYEKEGTVEIWAISDALEPLSGELHVQWMTMDGEVLAETRTEAMLEANASSLLNSVGAANRPANFDARTCLLVATLNIKNNDIDAIVHNLRPAKEQNFPESRIRWHVRDDGDVSIAADHYIRAVFLQHATPNGEAPINFNDNFFSLLPGEERVIRRRDGRPIDPALFSARALHQMTQTDAEPKRIASGQARR